MPHAARGGRFILALHQLEHVSCSTMPYCETENRVAVGDDRADLLRDHGPWSDHGEVRTSRSRRWLEDRLDDLLEWLENR